MTSWRNTTDHYGRISKLFHWTMAFLIILMLACGLTMEDAPKAWQPTLYGLHKSFGITLLGLGALRLMWRFINPPPALPATMSKRQTMASHIVHGILYGLLILMPLSGWLMSSGGGYPVSFFGLFTMPNLIGMDKELGEFFKETHEVFGNWLLILIALHIGAGVYHHKVLKDGVLKRMMPTCCKKKCATE